MLKTESTVSDIPSLICAMHDGNRCNVKKRGFLSMFSHHRSPAQPLNKPSSAPAPKAAPIVKKLDVDRSEIPLIP